MQAVATKPDLVVTPRGQGLLPNPWFDHAFTSGLFFVAMALGAVALRFPETMPWIVLANLWFFAYPHVASTYTRMAFDRASVREHWQILFVWPLPVLAATAVVAYFAGITALTTAYFIWQTWHYTRQSYGIARAYRRARGGSAEGRDTLTDVVIFAFPAWGLLNRMYQGPSEFYWNPVHLPPVPFGVVVAAGVLAVGGLIAWLVQSLRAGRSPFAPEGRFVLSHVAITTVSYLLVREITSGWLFINIWHNAQYLLFVYAFNARRYREGVDENHFVVSWVSQPSRVLAYVALCFVVGSGCYFLLGEGTARLAIMTAFPVVLVAHHAVNFHHYLADAVLWKTKPATKAPAQLA